MLPGITVEIILQCLGEFQARPSASASDICTDDDGIFRFAMKTLRALYNLPVARIAHCFGAKCQENAIRYVSTSMTCLAGNRRFTDKHEWISVNGNIGTVGISHHAQKSLGDIDFAQLPEVGTVLEKEVTCGALESAKAASEIFCPVSGKVIDKNTSVEQSPSLINNSCYDEGWLFKVELRKPDEVSRLMTESEYETFLKSSGQKQSVNKQE